MAKTNPKMFSVILLLAIVVSTVLITQPAAAATVGTCDSSGNPKSIFNPDEIVYLTASGLNASTTYPIYVVIKNESWTTDMAFPPRYYHTASNVATDSSGNISPTSIYTSVTFGEYYVAVDVNANGIYDSDDLLIDDLAITLEVTTKTSGGAVISTVYFAPDELYAMPSYTGVGSPRRSGGVFPLDMLGNYTGASLMALCNMVGGINSNSAITVSTAVDGYTTTIYYDYVHDNSYPQYNISTGAVIYGQQPIMILAYKVNGTMLSSDVTNTDSDLGGPLRLIVVANNGTSPILINDGMATFGYCYVKFVTKITITTPASLTYNTADDTGDVKTEFEQWNTVCLSATGLSADATYPVYVVSHVSEWAVRTIPERVLGSAETVSTDSAGNIVADFNAIYDGSETGEYDVVIDLNSDGIYDEADILIYNADNGICGFSVS